jgi:hypothetical protein
MPRPSTGNAYAGILPPWDLGAGTGPALPGAFTLIAPYLAHCGYAAVGGHRLLTRYGRYVLLTPHRVARAIIVGMTGMRWLRFLALNAAGAALWAGVWTTAGDVAGRHTGTIYPIITRYGICELAAVALVAAVLLVRLGVRRLGVRGLFVRRCHCDR